MYKFVIPFSVLPCGAQSGRGVICSSCWNRVERPQP